MDHETTKETPSPQICKRQDCFTYLPQRQGWKDKYWKGEGRERWGRLWFRAWKIEIGLGERRKEEVSQAIYIYRFNVVSHDPVVKI